MVSTTQLSGNRCQISYFCQALAEKLAQINVIQRDKKDGSEILLIAQYIESQLKGETLGDVKEAIDRHCRRSNYFPTIHDIIEILPDVHKASKQQAALPEKTQSKSTPGIHILLAHLSKKRASEHERIAAVSRFQQAYADCVRAGRQWPFTACNDNAAMSLIAQIVATKKSGNDLVQSLPQESKSGLCK